MAEIDNDFSERENSPDGSDFLERIKEIADWIAETIADVLFPNRD